MFTHRPVRSLLRRALLAGVCLLATGSLGAGRAHAQPSRDLGDYVLLADEALSMRTVTIAAGAVGVNDGALAMRGTIAAARSDLAACIVRTRTGTVCNRLFANTLTGSAPACPYLAGVSVPIPLIPDLRRACGYPRRFPTCAPHGADVRVEAGGMIDLPPGTYGTLEVRGGGSEPGGTAILTGDYVFCAVRLGKGARVLFRGPSTVHVAGPVRANTGAIVTPDPGIADLGAGDIRWFVDGPCVHLSRATVFDGTLCAPGAQFAAQQRTRLGGRVVARAIRLRGVTVGGPSNEPGVCGDGIVTPDEECESDEDCEESEGGTARHRRPGDARVCVACQCVPPGSTTTTTAVPTTTTTTAAPTTTTTSTTVTTTTTTVPECTTDADCLDRSPAGAFVCEDGRCVPGPTTTTTVVVPTTTTTGAPVTTTSTAVTTTTTTTVPECTTDADCLDRSPAGAFVCEDGRCVPGSTTTTTVVAPTTTTTLGEPPTTTTTSTLPATTTTAVPMTTTTEAPVTTTSTAVTTTTTTVPECTTDADCLDRSPAGAFVCEDGRCVPGPTTTTVVPATSTTTVVPATTTTTAGPVTTTTLPRCAGDEDCPPGEVCRDGRCEPAPPVREICGDCLDNDGDGLVDFEDAAECCGSVPPFVSNMWRARLRARPAEATRLRIKSRLADGGLGERLDPPRQQMALQIREVGGREVLCATFPAGSFARKGKWFRYRRTPATPETAQRIDRIRIRTMRSGRVKFRAFGKAVRFATPPAGALQITVGFARAGDDPAANVCSSMVRTFRATRNEIRYP